MPWQHSNIGGYQVKTPLNPFFTLFLFTSSTVQKEALERIAAKFETELSTAVGCVLAQSDEDLKMDLLHVKMSISNHSIYFYNLQGLLYQLKILRQ